MASVTTAVDGGTVTLSYESDPKTLDGLSYAELVETALGLVPALLHATTYVRPNLGLVAEILRTYADIWDQQENED